MRTRCGLALIPLHEDEQERLVLLPYHRRYQLENGRYIEAQGASGCIRGQLRDLWITADNQVLIADEG